MREFVKTHRLFALYTVLVLLIIFVALAAPMLAPQDPYSGDMKAVFCHLQRSIGWGQTSWAGICSHGLSMVLPLPCL